MGLNNMWFVATQTHTQEIHTQNCNIYKMNEVIIQKLEEITANRTLCEARKVAGSATYKESTTVRNCVVLLRSICLSSLFSHENKEFVSIVCLGIKQLINEDLSLQIEISSSKLQSAPLNVSWRTFIGKSDVSNLKRFRVIQTFNIYSNNESR